MARQVRSEQAKYNGPQIGSQTGSHVGGSDAWVESVLRGFIRLWNGRPLSALDLVSQASTSLYPQLLRVRARLILVCLSSQPNSLEKIVYLPDFTIFGPVLTETLHRVHQRGGPLQTPVISLQGLNASSSSSSSFSAPGSSR
jgi:hypothetical protein